MQANVQPAELGGRVRIPGSKSHTIRALLCAFCADGESVIREPLHSGDARSAMGMIRAFGAQVEENTDCWRVMGTGGQFTGNDLRVDVGNSGTSLYLGLALAAMSPQPVVFDGDAQIRRRSASGVLDALAMLGAGIETPNGCAPLTIRGPLHSGLARVNAVTSQYLTALLLAAPLIDGETVIDVPLLNERPYIDITLYWLRACGIDLEYNRNYSRFVIQGPQKYVPFERAIPADYSSAAFFIIASVIAGNGLYIEGLDPQDPQGDKRIIDILTEMGARRCQTDDGSLLLRGPLTRGGTFDLNDMPDALPALAVASCFAGGTVRLTNVAQARIKETDRIAVMAHELAAMGARVKEEADGLVIEPCRLHGADLDGHDDHRVVMSLAIAASAARGRSIIRGAEAAAVTFPGFFDLLRQCGGSFTLED